MYHKTHHPSPKESDCLIHKTPGVSAAAVKAGCERQTRESNTGKKDVLDLADYIINLRTGSLPTTSIVSLQQPGSLSHPEALPTTKHRDIIPTHPKPTLCDNFHL